MQLNPYLHFNGQCAEAFKFYEQCLGGKIVMMMTYGESPGSSEHTPPEMRDKIIHVRLIIGDQALMGSDSPPEYKEEAGGYSVSLSTNDRAEAERVFNALAENGTVKMPFQETFWAHGFGMLTDRFGVPWMVNCEKAQD